MEVLLRAVSRVVIGALFLLTSCAEQNAPVRVATVEIDQSGVTLLVGPGGGQVVQLSATTLDADGEALEDRTIAWSVQYPGVVTVSSTGLVTAIASGTATVRATSEGKTGSLVVVVAPVPITALDVTSAPLELIRTPLAVGSAQVVVATYDSTGAELVNRPLAWQSSNPLVASVNHLGLVTAVASAGSAYIVASANGLRDSVVVTVSVDNALPAGFDVVVTGALWTQATQTSAGSIPMLTGGRAAVVNVMTSSPSSFVDMTEFELRLYNFEGELQWSARRSASVRAGVTSTSAPTLQFLVPAAQLGPDLRWEVVWDPDEDFSDADEATDRLPREAPTALAVVQPPPLKLRFVPIFLSAHGGVAGNVTAGNVEEYLRVIRQFGPVGSIQYSIAPVFPTNVSFGVAPAGGNSPFWVSVLQELDIARVSDGTHADAHWVGVVQPPPGFNNSAFGGWGFIPNDGASIGPGTRTFLVVGANWFTREAQTRELVMHELGHNLGRRHAPCGGAAGPDLEYPIPGGVIGEGGHDTYTYERGFASTAIAQPSDYGDTMGYCTPVWISSYSYNAMLEFRGEAILALQDVPLRQRAVVVHGLADDAGNAQVQRAVVVPGTSALAPDAGDWEARLVNAAGEVLARRRFALGHFDHLDNQRPISVAIPIDGLNTDQVVRIEVRSPNGRVASLAFPHE